jgi:hypothetical protein
MRALPLVLLLAGRVAWADDSWQCSERIVTTGEREPAVLEKCGAPAERARRFVRRRWGTTSQVIDLWRYDRGPNELVRMLTFVDGALVTIETGDYGR